MYRRSIHRWRGLRRRLDRGGLVGLFLALSLGLIEPCACALHCAILDALLRMTPAHTAHHQHDSAHQAHPHDQHSPTLPAPQPTAASTSAGPASVLHCHGPGGPEHQPLARALHELAPAALIALLLHMLLAPLARRPLPHPSGQTHRPPLPPPRALAC